MTGLSTAATLIIALVLGVSAVSIGPTHHDSIPGYSDPVDIWSGFIEVDEVHEGSLFYMFYPSLNDPSNDPVAIWLNGGPGSSSLWGMLNENGPLRVLDDGNLTENPFGWNAEASIIFIDQPVGTGMSYVKDTEGLVTDEVGVGQGLLNFMLEFYSYPEFEGFKNNPLFVAGESYAGKYVPAAGLAFLDYNDAAGDGEWTIPLEGLAIGNGWTDPIEQNAALIEYAFGLGLIDTPERTAIWAQYSDCMDMLFSPGHPDPMDVFEVCEGVFGEILDYGGVQDPYDIRNLHAFDDGAETYLSRQDVREALEIPEWKEWNDQGDLVNHALNPEVHISSDIKPQMPRLLKAVRTLFYTGNTDLTCPVNSIERWLRTVPWEHAAEWRSAKREFSYLAGDNANNTRRAWVKTVDNLSEMHIHGAGHFVPLNQPEFSLDMINRFMANEPLCGDGSAECSYAACPNACSERGRCNELTGECNCADPAVAAPSGAEYKGKGCGTVEWGRDAIVSLPTDILSGYLAPGEWALYRFPLASLPYEVRVVLERSEEARYGLPDLYVAYGQAPSEHRYADADLTSDSHHELLLDLAHARLNSTKDLDASDLFIGVHNSDYREVRYEMVLSEVRKPFNPVILMPMAIMGGVVGGAVFMWMCVAWTKESREAVALSASDEGMYLLSGDT